MKKTFRKIYLDINKQGEIIMANDEKKWPGEFSTTVSVPETTPLVDWHFGAIPEGVHTSRHHTVHIDKVDNGFIVKIGCKTFVETNWNNIFTCLCEYWDDPIAAEKKYCK
jgi:hypothetical protein